MPWALDPFGLSCESDCAERFPGGDHYSLINYRRCLRGCRSGTTPAYLNSGSVTTKIEISECEIIIFVAHSPVVKELEIDPPQTCHAFYPFACYNGGDVIEGSMDREGVTTLPVNSISKWPDRASYRWRENLGGHALSNHNSGNAGHSPLAGLNDVIKKGGSAELYAMDEMCKCCDSINVFVVGDDALIKQITEDLEAAMKARKTMHPMRHSYNRWLAMSQGGGMVLRCDDKK